MTEAEALVYTAVYEYERSCGKSVVDATEDAGFALRQFRSAGRSG